MKKTLMKVTAEHISAGVRNAPQFCPIAIALKTQLNPGFVSVGSIRYNVEDNRYKLPRSAQRFVARFDKGKPVKPFNFYHVED